jgi:transmembrane sensor
MRFRAGLWVKRRNKGVSRAKLRVDIEGRPDSSVAADDGCPARAIAKAALAILLLWLTWAHPSRTYETEVGEMRSIRLEEGSVIVLNSNTEIRVDVNAYGRHIELVRGEALFDVAHNPRWTFDVSARGITTRAVGTSFDVRLTEDNELTVMVIEGRVCMGGSAEVQAADFAQTSRFALVGAGQMATMDRGIISIAPDRMRTIDRKLAWTRGKLMLDSLTLAEAVVEINRYNKEQLEIGDPTIARLMPGGTIGTKGRQAFLDWLRLKYKIVAVISGKTMEGATISRLCGPRAPPGCTVTTKTEGPD